MVLHQLSPLVAADEESLACRHSFVGEECALVEGDAVSSNDVAILETQNKCLDPVNLEADFESAIVDEDDLVDFIQFFVDHFIGTLLPRLE